MIRLFAALAIPEPTGVALQTRQTGIEGARWRPLAALHITLRFFGDLREDVARDLDAELMTVAARPFEITLSGAGCFSDNDGPEAVWAGVADSPELTRLARACEGAARRIGLAPSTRGYRPHVTLAYLRRANLTEVAHWIQAHNLLKSPAIPVDRFGLYSSIQTKDGSVYRLEAEYPLT